MIGQDIAYPALSQTVVLQAEKKSENPIKYFISPRNVQFVHAFFYLEALAKIGDLAFLLQHQETVTPHASIQV